jgi:hypothetical protein
VPALCRLHTLLPGASGSAPQEAQAGQVPHADGQVGGQFECHCRKKTAPPENTVSHEPPPDPSALPRPAHDPPHDRFFEDGEEPPERYDLDDPADYIPVNANPIESSRWRERGWEFGHRSVVPSIVNAAGAYFFALASFAIGCVWLYAVIAPTLFATITVGSLALLTSNHSRFAIGRPPWRHLVALAVANFPALISQVAMLTGLVVIGGRIVKTLIFIDGEISYGHKNWHELPDDWFLDPGYILCALVLILAHAFVAVRASGFATHLILDYDLSPFQAIRANWLVTKSRTRQLMVLKMRLWFWKALMIASIYGCWLVILYEPYASTVWAAAYLDIAGSEPICEGIESASLK